MARLPLQVNQAGDSSESSSITLTARWIPVSAQVVFLNLQDFLNLVVRQTRVGASRCRRTESWWWEARSRSQTLPSPVMTPPPIAPSIEDALAQLAADLAAVQASVDALEAKLDAIEGKLDTNLDTTVSSRASQASVDDLDGDIAALEAKLDAIEGKLDTNLDATVSSRATQASVDDLDGDIAALEAKLDAIEGKLDTNLDATVSSRATQTSVDDLESKLDSIDATLTGPNRINLEAIRIKNKKRYLLVVSLDGATVDTSLVRLLAYRASGKKPVVVHDVTADTTSTVVSTGISGVASGVLDVTVDLPRPARKSNLFQFVVTDSEGNIGTITVGNGGGHDDD